MIVSIVKDCVANSSVIRSDPLGEIDDDPNTGTGFISGISW